MRHITSIISKYFGYFATTKFPKPIQISINFLYVKILGIDMSEFEPIKNYKSLNSLFSRPLKKNREIDNNENSIISPVDGTLLEQGFIEDGKVYQIKGMEYSLDKLLNGKSLESGFFVNIYLSPRNYHRYHSPCDLKVNSLTYISGKLYSVSPFFLKYKEELFCENERVIIEAEDNKKNSFIIVLVGALNVGKMVVVFEERVKTNIKKEISTYTYDDLYLKKGELIGWFEMGSTVLLFSSNKNIEFKAQKKERVVFGKNILNYLS